MWFKCKLKLLSLLNSSRNSLKEAPMINSKWLIHSKFLILDIMEQLLRIPVYHKTLTIKIFNNFPPIIIIKWIKTETKNNQVTISALKMIKENQKLKNWGMRNIQKLKLFKIQNLAKKIKNLICKKRNLSQKWKMIKLIRIQKTKSKTIKAHNRTDLNC